MQAVPPVISPMFNASQNLKKTILDYFSNDIATGLKKVIS
jgi:hypothetical protein